MNDDNTPASPERLDRPPSDWNIAFTITRPDATTHQLEAVRDELRSTPTLHSIHLRGPEGEAALDAHFLARASYGFDAAREFKDRIAFRLLQLGDGWQVQRVMAMPLGSQRDLLVDATYRTGELNAARIDLIGGDHAPIRAGFEARLAVQLPTEAVVSYGLDGDAPVVSVIAPAVAPQLPSDDPLRAIVGKLIRIDPGLSIASVELGRFDFARGAASAFVRAPEVTRAPAPNQLGHTR